MSIAILQPQREEEGIGRRKDSIKESSEGMIILHAKRWRVLFSFSILSMSSAWIWITWSPIARQAADFWDVPLGHVDALAGIYLYVYVPCSFLSLYMVVNYLGLYKGLLVGAAFNVTGAIVRYRCMHTYRAVYIGTLLCAVAQTFTLSTPPFIAASWFGASERATATGLGVLANQLGTAMGLGATILVDFAPTEEIAAFLDESKLRAYLGLQALTAFIALVLVSILGGDKPSTPPSFAEAKQKENSDRTHRSERTLLNASPSEVSALMTNRNDGQKYVESIGSVFFSVNNSAYMLSFGMAVGVFYTIPAFVSQLTPPSWSPRDNGWLGVFYQVLGAYASFQAGRIVDATQQHRTVCLILLFAATISLIIMVFAQSSLETETWQTNLEVFVGISVAGLSLAAWNSVGLELGTGICHPANEAAVAGVLEASAELFGFFWVLLGGKLIDTPKIFLTLLSTVVGIAGVILFKSDTRMKRPV